MGWKEKIVSAIRTFFLGKASQIVRDGLKIGGAYLIAHHVGTPETVAPVVQGVGDWFQSPEVQEAIGAGLILLGSGASAVKEVKASNEKKELISDKVDLIQENVELKRKVGDQ